MFHEIEVHPIVREFPNRAAYNRALDEFKRFVAGERYKGKGWGSCYGLIDRERKQSTDPVTFAVYPARWCEKDLIKFLSDYGLPGELEASTAEMLEMRTILAQAFGRSGFQHYEVAREINEIPLDPNEGGDANG